MPTVVALDRPPIGRNLSLDVAGRRGELAVHNHRIGRANCGEVGEERHGHRSERRRAIRRTIEYPLTSLADRSWRPAGEALKRLLGEIIAVERTYARRCVGCNNDAP
jgi:hypothetical protein